MLQLIAQKLLNGLVTLFVVMSVTFFLIRVLPGGPFDQERKLPPAIQANLEAKYHLNEPAWKQYTYYIGGLLQGDLGPSYKYLTRNVNDIVAEGMGTSFKLGMLALILGVSGGLLLGTWAGTAKAKWLDASLSMLGMSSISMPSFIFGALLVLVFSYFLKWLPAARLESPAHFILPVTTLALTPFAYTFLLVRSSVRETSRQLFVQIKRSFGLPEGQVTLLHILRNSLISLISVLGPLSAMVITGSFAVELIFAIPGLGKYFVTAVINRDYTLVMGITLVYSMALVVFNLLTDLAYGWADPRLQPTGSHAA